MEMKEIIARIEAIVRECGHIMLGARRNASLVETKEGHANFVTFYDKQVQRILQEKLTVLFPEAHFVGEEEEEHSDVASGYAFIVDPIDGTTNFIKDYKVSCISVGLTRDGRPFAGVVYNPYLDEMFTATEGQGAFCNGIPIHVSHHTLEDGLVLFGTSPYHEELRRKSFDAAYALCSRALDLRRSGSAALDLCSLAAGRAELYFECILQPWDYAAGAAILLEAGGSITTMEGLPITLERPCSILASNGRADGLSVLQTVI